MRVEVEPLNLILIEKYAGRAALIRRAIDANNVNCHLNTIDHGKSALAYLRRISPYKDAPAPDLVLFDFAEPDRADWSLLNRLALSPGPVSSPVVLLTSRASEALIESRFENRGDTHFFASVGLTAFLRRMNDIPCGRFLRALSLISELGPIMVRLPGFITTNKEHSVTAMIA